MKATKINVYNPSGDVDLTKKPAPRVPDLNGKRVGLLWNGVFRGNETFPFLQQALKERFPGADILAYDQLPIDMENAQNIGRIVKEKGCDAVISGNGG